MGTAVWLEATVDTVPPGGGQPIGQVTFIDTGNPTDTCIVTAAPWTCQITFTAAGPRSVTASYVSSDGNHAASVSSPVIQDVLPDSNTFFTNIVGPNGIIIDGLTETCVQTYSVKALDVDNVSNVVVEYSLNDTFDPVGVTTVPLTNTSGATWESSFSVTGNDGNRIFWRFKAIDGIANETCRSVGTTYTPCYTGTTVSASFFDLSGTNCP